MKVAVYTIALNESKFIKRWYESAKEADYILIADTGSDDDTYDIAEELGIEVVGIKVMPWRFDVARNTALSLLPADTDYCIALDMDEILLPGWKKQLELAKEKNVTRPRYKYTWSWRDKEETLPGLQYGGDKVHKRYGYRWKHPVHEVLVPDRIEETQDWFDFEIHHHPDPGKSRSQYLPLLELSVKEDPWDDRNSHYYARELFFYQNFEMAKKEFIRHLSLPGATWGPERANSMRYIAKCSSGSEKEEWLIRATSEAPDRREAMVDLAEYYFDEGRWEDCISVVKKLTKITEKPLEYLCEEKAWGPFPYKIGALSALNIKDESLAKEWGLAFAKLL